MKNRSKNRTGIVFSTEQGRTCPECGMPVKSCICKGDNSAQKSDGTVRIWLEKKGRRGKAVTLIKGVPLENSELKNLLKDLKRKCGTGGTMKNNIMEIQGDFGEVLAGELTKLGYSVKL